MCQALRAMEAAHPGVTVFNGGARQRKPQPEAPSPMGGIPASQVRSVGRRRLPSSILLELGQSTGHDPNEPREVTSLLARQLSATVNVSDFPDLAAFSVRSDVIPRLRVEHANAMRDLYYGPGAGPSFDSVLHRVSEYGILLDVG